MHCVQSRFNKQRIAERAIGQLQACTTGILLWEGAYLSVLVTYRQRKPLLLHRWGHRRQV